MFKTVFLQKNVKNLKTLAKTDFSLNSANKAQSSLN